MIRLHKISWKNFLSTGNTFTTIELDTHRHTLIVGKNGDGKSTLLDSLCFALFNRPFRKINKPNLVNSINGRECVTEITFSVDGVPYRVVRGIKPAIFEIYQDNTLINQDAEARDYQDYLETTILKMNYKSFTQIAVLGSASFTPFMQLTSADRRAIIEDLLDIQIFSSMNTLLKERVSKNKEALTTNKVLIESANEKVDLQRKHVATLTQNQERQVDALNHERVDHVAKIADQERQLQTLSESLLEVVESMGDAQDVQQKLVTLNKLDAQIRQTYTKQQKSLSFFQDHDRCPTCQQQIEQTFRHDQLTLLRQKMVDLEEGIAKLETRIASVETRLADIKELERTMRTIETEMATRKQSIRQLRQWIETIDMKLTRVQTGAVSAESEQQQLESYERAVVSLTETRQTLLHERQYCEAAAVLLKDSGIKTKIVQQYLPVINTLVNKYLRALDFSVNFLLDESFSETIKSRYRDEFQYASFSEGEKQKIDMALMLTWRAVAKLKNSMNTNVLILDEVFDSSLDLAGTEELLKILTVLEDTNVFVITHRGDTLHDKFERVIKFRKTNNFSQVVQ